MEARCKKCNKYFHYRNFRGNKLAYYTCECGGSYEALGGNHCLSGVNPVEPMETHESEFIKGNFYHAQKNKEGRYFVESNGFFIEIENPVIAIGWVDHFIQELKDHPPINLVKQEEQCLEFCTHTYYTWKDYKVKRTEYKNGLIQWRFMEGTYIPLSIEFLLEKLIH